MHLMNVLQLFLGIHEFVEGHMNCFQVLVIINRVTINICIHLFSYEYVFNSLR